MPLVKKAYGSGHTYQLDVPKGGKQRKVDGVTGVAGYCMKGDSLVFGATKVAAEVSRRDYELLARMDDKAAIDYVRNAHRREWDEAARRGTETHKWIENTLRGDKPLDPSDSVAPYVEQVQRFLKRWDPQPVKLEMVVGSREHAYAGTADFVGDLAPFGRVILDWKTKTNEPVAYPNVALQLAAYRWSEFFVEGEDDTYTETPTSSLGIETAVAVVFGATDFNVFPIEATRTEFTYWLYGQRVARFDKVHGKTVIGKPVEGPSDDWLQEAA